MKKNHLLSLLFCLIAIGSFAQHSSQIDSLKQIFESAKPAGTRLKACEHLLEAFITSKDSTSLMQYMAKGVALAERVKDKRSKHKLLIKEGSLLLHTGHYSRAKAIYQNALQKSRQEGWKVITADCLTSLGLIYHYQTEYDKAMPLLTESLEVKKSLKDTKGVGRAYINIAKVYFKRGDFQKALALCEKALKVSLRIGDIKNIIRSYNDLGIIYGTLQDLQKSSDHFLKGLEVAEENQNWEGLSMTYGNLSVLSSIRNDYKQAMFYLKQCIALYKEQKDQLNSAVTITTLASLHYKQGNYEESLRLSDSVNSYYIESGHKDYLAANYNQIGGNYRQLGDLNKAKYYFKKAALTYEETQDKYGMAKNYSVLGKIFLGENQEDSAFIYFEKAFRLFEETKNTNTLIAAYRDIGQIYTKQGNLPEAIVYYKKALNKAELTKDTLATSKIYAAIGDLYMEQNIHDNAFSSYQDALQGFQRIDASSRVADMNIKLAKVFNRQQKYRQAIKFGKSALDTYQQFNDNCSYGSAYLTMAQSYIALKKKDSGGLYLNKALSSALACENVESTVLASVYGALGAFYQDQQQQDSALVAYKSALKYATLSKNRLVMKNAAKALYPVYEQRGQFKKAFATFHIFYDNEKALYNEENTRALVQQEYDKELQQKALFQQQKEAELAKQKWITATMIGACLAFILIAFAFYKNYQSKNKANKLLRAKNVEISEQRARLEVLDHTKSRFFTNISHELRTPLTLISSPLQSLLKNTKEQFLPSTKETLHLMYRNTETLKGLVNDILDISKLESDKMELQEEEVAIKSLLKHVAANFDTLASHQGIRYEQDLHEIPDVTVLLDAGKAEKILNNLLSNAIKNTPSGGEVVMIARVEGRFLQVQVKDTGRGIDPKDLPFIFERFYQSTQPGAPLQGGTGIGLALAKEFCKFIGGSITVASELHKGSIFTVKLPYRVIENPVEVPEAELFSDENGSVKALLTSKTTSGKQHKILIVEDHPDMQAYVNSLINADHITLLASNGKEALKVLEQETVDLIITDVMMPEMDGYSLLLKLKESEKYHHIPVIMLTALGDTAHKLQALTIGVDDYLTKPFSPQELLVRVQNLLEHYESRLQWKTAAAEEEEFEPEAVAPVPGDSLEDDIFSVSHQLKNKWLKKVAYKIATNLENEEFRLTELADEFNLSYRQFLRRIKTLTGLSLKQYQQEIALQKARELLEKGKYGNASAVACSVGMNNVTRFSRLYEARFGKKPNEYFISFAGDNDV
jgi:signal transduction histidine kinase/DNA-binding response OmpR family regulator